MKKIIKLTESDITKVIKLLISEQVFKFIKQFLIRSGNSLISAGGKTANLIDEILSKAASKENSLIKQGELYIISKSGAKIHTSQIDKAIGDIINGAKSWEEVSNRFPRYLADGTEFREVFAKIFRSGNEVAPRLKVGSVGRSFMDMVRESAKTWVKVSPILGNYSGWKFHIYCTTLEEVGYLYEKLNGVTKSWGAEFKLGSMSNLDAQRMNPKQIGKGATIYIPSWVIKEGKQKSFLSAIQGAISDYPTSGGIYGDEMITNNIGYRYEFYKPINSKIGVNGDEYMLLYQGNRGSHNIPGQTDIF
jgi:hypothetical protein